LFSNLQGGYFFTPKYFLETTDGFNARSLHFGLAIAGSGALSMRLSVSAPSFPLFFTGYGVANVAERSEVYNFGGVVTARESWGVLALVFCYAAFEVIGYTCV
jgi:hypothetical protein